MNDFFGILAGVKQQRIVLAILVVAIYATSLLNGFVWDDTIYFIDNPVYAKFHLGKMLFSLANGVEYLPVRDVTYALDYLLWGKNPFGFHFTNLVFFTGNILLIHHFSMLIGKKLADSVGRSASPFLPFAVSAAFAVHPINTEAVNFITCRNVLVSALFVFLSCILMFRYLENDSRKLLWGAFVTFVMAMLAKATAIMLPLIFLLFYPILFPGRSRKIVLSVLPFLAAATGFFILFKRIAENARITNADLLGFNLWETTAIAIQIPFFYLKKLLLPYGFSVEYVPDFSSEIISAKVLAAIVCIAVLVAAAVYWRKTFPEFTAGFVWFTLALVPALNFFGTYPVVADRYAFLPTFGFMLVAAGIIDRIQQNRVKSFICLTAGLLLSVIVVTRTRAWHSNETLWQATIKSSPNATKAYTSLAAIYFNNHQEQKAIDLLSANRTVPGLAIYLDYYAGKKLFAQNEPVKAKERFQQALAGASGFVSALYYMGKIAEIEGDLVSAIQYYHRAIVSIEDDTFLERQGMMRRLDELKKRSPDHYMATLKQHVAKNPDDLNAHRELALTLDRLGLYEEALLHYLVIAKGSMGGWQLDNNIANCYFNLNRDADAVRYYEKAVSQGGGSEDTFNNLGVAYRRQGDLEKSIQILQVAVKKYPNAPYPAFNLAIAYYNAGQKEMALARFVEVERQFPELKPRTSPFITALQPKLH